MKLTYFGQLMYCSFILKLGNPACTEIQMFLFQVDKLNLKFLTQAIKNTTAVLLSF